MTESEPRDSARRPFRRRVGWIACVLVAVTAGCSWMESPGARYDRRMGELKDELVRIQDEMQELQEAEWTRRRREAAAARGTPEEQPERPWWQFFKGDEPQE